MAAMPRSRAQRETHAVYARLRRGEITRAVARQLVAAAYDAQAFRSVAAALDAAQAVCRG